MGVIVPVVVTKPIVVIVTVLMVTCRRGTPFPRRPWVCHQHYEQGHTCENRHLPLVLHEAWLVWESGRNFSHPQGRLLLLINQHTNMRWVVALSWGMGLGHGVGANWNRPHEVDLKIPTCCLNFDLNFPNWEIGTLKLRLLVTGVEGRVEGRVGHVWTSLMVQTRCLSPKTWQWKFNVYLQG